MARDAEQRLIAYVTLLVVAIAAGGWAAWVLAVAGSPAAVSRGLLGALGVVVLSISAGPVAVAVRGRIERDWAVTARKVTLFVVLALVVGSGIFVLARPAAAVPVATVTGLVAVWVLVPLAIGSLSATTGGTSMLSVLLAWPVTNVLALAVLAAPRASGVTEIGTASALALPEPARTGVVLVAVAVVSFGPTLLGKLIDRWLSRASAG